MRLQKFMACAGIASRRKCEELISAGFVSVNGRRATVGESVDPDNDDVMYDGKKVTVGAEKIVIAFNKPKFVLCSSSDPQGRKTVQDYFTEFPVRLYNVGRLDYDSQGLVFMTNDGDFAYAVMHPSREIEKEYYVVCDGVLSADEAASLSSGVMLEDGKTSPATIRKVKPVAEGRTSFCISIHEGRNRQIRRMLAAVGHKTLLLRRIRIGQITLGELSPGEWRRLTKKETELFLGRR